MDQSISNNAPPLPQWYDADAVRRRLDEVVTWPDGVTCSDVVMTRLWPGARRIGIEWTLVLSCGEYVIQGAVGSVGDRHTYDGVVLSDHGLANIRVGDEELGVYWCSPDRDPKLKHLRPMLVDQQALMAAVPQELGHACTVDVVAYRMHRRCVLRIRGSREMYAKVMRRAPSAEQMSALATIGQYIARQSKGAVKVPPMVLHDVQGPLLITESVPRARPCDVARPADLHRAAHGLCIVHGHAPPRGNPHGPADELAIVHRWCALLAEIDHWGTQLLRELVAGLQAYASCVIGDTCLVHRDFHEGQLLCDDDAMWLIDFDTLGGGHAEVDLATFCAHIMLDTLSCGGTRSTAMGRIRDFMDAYSQCGGHINSSRLRFYLPSALLRLGAIHCVRDIAPHIIFNLWNLAGQALDEPQFSIA